MSVVYRQLAAADAEAYRAIRLESLKASPDAFGSSYEAQRALPKLMFEAALEEGARDRFVVGAFGGWALIGICGFVAAADGAAGEIIQMYVRPFYSGRKIGLHLVKAVITDAFRLPGIEQIVLGVHEENSRAVRVYEQAGFVRAGAMGIEVEDGFLQMIMQRRID